jgi:hypothetical protein
MFVVGFSALDSPLNEQIEFQCFADLLSNFDFKWPVHPSHLSIFRTLNLAAADKCRGARFPETLNEHRPEMIYGVQLTDTHVCVPCKSRETKINDEQRLTFRANNNRS